MYAVIAEQATSHPVAFMCRTLGVSRPGYYRWKEAQRRPPTSRAQRRARITEAVQQLYDASHGRVGRRPMQALLATAGFACSRGLVHRVMADLGLQAARHRAWHTTTRQDPHASTAHISNLCLDAAGHRDFTSPTPGTRLVGDITMIRTAQGWAHLAVVIDLATRAVVGWACRPQMRTELVLAAMRMARDRGYVQPGTIFHSDRGTQYTAATFQAWCRQHQVRQSMGQTGVCWDNAAAESFFATLKSDLHVEARILTHQEAKQRLFLYIEGWYNRRRPHTHNAGQTPQQALEHARAP